MRIISEDDFFARRAMSHLRNGRKSIPKRLRTCHAVSILATASFGDILREALRRLITEILSSYAAQSGDGSVRGVGGGLLSVLSDNGGVLRLAILEWTIDRWTVTSSSASPRSDDDPPPPTLANGDGDKDGSGSC